MTYKNRKCDLTQFIKKTMFFMTAFIPLWVILIINYTMTKGFNWYFVIGSSAFLISLFFTVMVYLRKIRKGEKEKQYFKVVGKTNITHDVVFYTLAYIPILLLSEFKWKEVITFSITLFTIYVLYIKTNMIHINPILALMQYKMYKVTDDHDNTVVMLSKLNVKTGVEVPCREIADEINIVLDGE